ncbi:tyrosine-protein phosphatase non-receptor type 2-like [Cotesia glomerata]|uniref:tyrosine-protein phosphatase non-receptor type 2-like n=1 Tax=Cotesia glomerata TaxID=32391 RepID=UPI001D01BA3E|nr:tyrosine-protein phosphatase non-receptor type 2-like [Cotesia glomerata]
MAINSAVHINASDFLSFINKPDSLTRIIEEYYAIVPKHEKKENSVSAQNENKCKKELGMHLTRYLESCIKLRNDGTVLDASFVDGYDIKRKYICIKSLQQDDCDKFWQLVSNYKVQIIVLISRLSDKKCYQYWSSKEGCVKVMDKFRIKTLKISIKPHYNLTLLSLTDKFGRVQKISHYQYTAWPEDNFSHKPNAFIDFYCNIKDMCLQLGRQTADKKIAPIIVQCLDGIGSSAVFCVFDICAARFDKTGTLSLPSVLKKGRQQKYGFMNCLDDYVLCYQLLAVYVKEKLFMLHYI